ncbi:ATP synthase subunit d, mitochondrial [Ischnura elegans]|uniref:ATP synthase subunit d, mitochondrial n=1 Tax=Ischnura elegans TaxID=197161 RepID=UPI001ED88758|nr:ATP synthase subunit d, mitochondrial [Ischnura elegans]
MAARRITKSSINWQAMLDRVHPEQQSYFVAFKAKADNYLRRVMANPAALPKIDWAHYKKSVPVAGMVDTFQKQYESIQIPYPPDTMTASVEAQEKEVMAEVKKFVAESNTRITEYQKELDHLNSLLPINQMTMEDYKDAYPELALDGEKRPTFWPHTPEEQPGMEQRGEGSAH